MFRRVSGNKKQQQTHGQAFMKTLSLVMWMINKLFYIHHSHSHIFIRICFTPGFDQEKSSHHGQAQHMPFISQVNHVTSLELGLHLLSQNPTETIKNKLYHLPVGLRVYASFYRHMFTHTESFTTILEAHFIDKTLECLLPCMSALCCTRNTAYQHSAIFQVSRSRSCCVT